MTYRGAREFMEVGPRRSVGHVARKEGLEKIADGEVIKTVTV